MQQAALPCQASACPQARGTAYCPTRAGRRLANRSSGPTSNAHTQETSSQWGEAPPPTCVVHFKAAGISVVTTPGQGPRQTIAEVAHGCGVDIVLGCGSGSCGVCEVEVSKLAGGQDVDPSPAVVRSCVAGIPPGYARIEVQEVADAIWGSDFV